MIVSKETDGRKGVRFFRGEGECRWMLNERQRRFVEAYLECGVAAKAARTVGYKGEYGCRLLKKPEVKQYAQLLREEAQMEEIRMEEARMAVAGGEEVLGFLTNVMREGKGPAAMKAAELLGKRMGLFSEQGEELPVPVIVDDLAGEEA